MKLEFLGLSMRLRGLCLMGVVLLGIAGCDEATPVDPPVCGDAPMPQARGAWQCGPTLDFTPVNSYQGEFSDVMDREDAVVFIDGRCTGTLIAASAGPVVLTAGHCVGLGDRPLLVFNFEDAPDGDPLITEGTVIEQALEPDYALIELDMLPAATPVLLTNRITQQLAIIQHPRGRPKVIAEGEFLDSCHRLVYYSDLDTLVASSGAGVLNRQGFVLGVHTDGNCDESGRGANSGWLSADVVDASEYLQSVDIADR